MEENRVTRRDGKRVGESREKIMSRPRCARSKIPRRPRGQAEPRNMGRDRKPEPVDWGCKIDQDVGGEKAGNRRKK